MFKSTLPSYLPALQLASSHCTAFTLCINRRVYCVHVSVSQEVIFTGLTKLGVALVSAYVVANDLRLDGSDATLLTESGMEVIPSCPYEQVLRVCASLDHDDASSGPPSGAGARTRMPRRARAHGCRQARLPALGWCCELIKYEQDRYKY